MPFLPGHCTHTHCPLPTHQPLCRLHRGHPQAFLSSAFPFKKHRLGGFAAEIHSFHFKNPMARYLIFQTELHELWHGTRTLGALQLLKAILDLEAETTAPHCIERGRIQTQLPSLAKELEDCCQDLFLILSTDLTQRGGSRGWPSQSPTTLLYCSRRFSQLPPLEHPEHLPHLIFLTHLSIQLSGTIYSMPENMKDL